MKVRHKKTGVELEICPSNEAFARGGDVYRRTTGGSFINTSDQDWQLVPEEEWEDCTESCHFYAGNEALTGTAGLLFVHRNGSVYGDKVITEGNGYRFTKIDGLHHGPAFIVERRKEQ